jgi:hypothetical protein
MQMSFALRRTVMMSSAFWVLQRVHYNGSNITQATVTSITWKIWDSFTRTGADVVDSGTLTVSSVVFDTLQTDGKWTDNPVNDDTGYNFAHAIPSTAIDNAGEYRLEHEFTMSDGGVFVPCYWLLTAVDVLS